MLTRIVAIVKRQNENKLKGEKVFRFDVGGKVVTIQRVY